MGLEKKLSTRFRVDANYSTITRSIIYKAREAFIRVTSYPSRAAYRNGAEPLAEHDFRFTPDIFPFDKQSGIPQQYRAIREYVTRTEEGDIPSIFADAVDVLEDA